MSPRASKPPAAKGTSAKSAPAKTPRKRRKQTEETPGLSRLERILLLVPYCVKRPGTTIDELAGRFAATRQDILDDLNLVFVCGLPDYTPADLIEVAVEEDRVYIRMADYFSRPSRLTRSEAIPLYLKAHALTDLMARDDGAPGLDELGPLRSALGKLAAALLPQEGGVAELTKRIKVHLEAGEARWLPLLRRAVTDHQRVEMEYYTYSRDTLTTRRFDPVLVFASLGHWYTSGYCHLARDSRTFRLDRIRSLALTSETFEPSSEQAPDLPPPLLYVPGPADATVTVRVAERVAVFLEEYLPVESSTAVPGGRELTFRTSAFEWLEKLLLRYGTDVEVVDPPELAERVRAGAERILALYERGRPAKVR